MTAAGQLAQLEWARDCYAAGLGRAVEEQIAYLRKVVAGRGCGEKGSGTPATPEDAR